MHFGCCGFVCRTKELSLIEGGYRNALLAGASHLGVTNWLAAGLGMDGAVRELIHRAEPTCGATELVGVFLHLDSCSAWQGPQVG